ncbi:glycosyltransferase [Demequina sp. SYSU T00039]|uniref:D-inositol 3-phosphate glycosyltransferase n=1 Tax=Demequina lignilytica TaxID=3051663 RepID=A0AAW7M9S6_9MICO|nr:MULTISPECIES: glycosyltransferase [unclassified Demequina]MDN4477422.1 glycosyltransferase [Demequina sp. SYSU T00039-1]MDN4488227.1 glycosyltransferase [Demequina sp. SYSU T00039]
MTGDDRRIRSVVYAYTCDDRQGSEPGAGAALAEVAGRVSTATVVTRGLESPAADEELRARLGVEAVVALRPFELERRLPLHVQYAAWCVRAARWTARERRDRAFDVLHHATYASDWFLNPLTFLRKRPGERWVLGPIGGASYPSAALAREVTGARAVGLTARRLATSASRRLFIGPLAARVDRALALNADTERVLRRLGYATVDVTSNAVLDDAVAAYRVPERDRTVAFLGRGVAWKGLRAVLAAARHLPADVTVHVAGPDTDTPEHRELAQDAACPVVFHGRLSRPEALALMARSGALALPSLHDSAPWAAAEAAELGVPTVCLPLGGVPFMAGPAAVTVDPEGDGTLAERLAAALLRAIDLHPPVEPRFTVDRMVETIGGAYGGETVRR